MSVARAARVAPAPALGDLVALVKPRIMLMALLTAAGGLGLAPVATTPATWLALVLGTGLIVGAANTLNMYLERDIDCLMARTRERPLPGGRLDPAIALGFGVAQAVVSVPLLTFAVNPLTGALGVLALICYVNVYTPLKQRTTLATWVGAVPGATPALMGWTAATGSIDPGGVAVFAVLFLWQIPHFHAIALFRQKEYDRAGLVTLPGARGVAPTRRAIVGYLILQVAVSLALVPLGVAGVAYLAVAIVAGVAYLWVALAGARRGNPARWGKRLFVASIVYLPVLFTALVADGLF